MSITELNKIRTRLYEKYCAAGRIVARCHNNLTTPEQAEKDMMKLINPGPPDINDELLEALEMLMPQSPNSTDQFEPYDRACWEHAAEVVAKAKSFPVGRVATTNACHETA